MTTASAPAPHVPLIPAKQSVLMTATYFDGKSLRFACQPTRCFLDAWNLVRIAGVQRLRLERDGFFWTWENIPEPRPCQTEIIKRMVYGS